MGYDVKMLKDSVSFRGHRVSTFQVTLPRIVLAEFNTHAAVAKNSASSRAIPSRRVIGNLLDDWFTPDVFGTAAVGMNAGRPLSGELDEIARKEWNDSMLQSAIRVLRLMTSPEVVDRAMVAAQAAGVSGDYNFIRYFVDTDEYWTAESKVLNVSKGLANRLVEPYSFQTIIVTGTDLENFFNLRTHKDAQEEIRIPAQMMLDLYNSSTPVQLSNDEWHLPFILDSEIDWAREFPEQAARVSAARVARVSYARHDTGEVDVDHDLERALSLIKSGHMSPTEQQLRPMSDEEWAFRSALKKTARGLAVSPRPHPTTANGRSGSKPISDIFLEDTLHQLDYSGKFKGWVALRQHIPSQRVFSPAS